MKPRVTDMRSLVAYDIRALAPRFIRYFRTEATDILMLPIFHVQCLRAIDAIARYQL